MSATDEFARRLRAAANEIDHTTTGIEGDAAVIRLGELAQTVRKIANEIDHLGVAPTSATAASEVRCSFPAVVVGGRPDWELSLLAQVVHLVDTNTVSSLDAAAARRMAAWLTERFGEPDA